MEDLLKALNSLKDKKNRKSKVMKFALSGKTPTKSNKVDLSKVDDLNDRLMDLEKQDFDATKDYNDLRVAIDQNITDFATISASYDFLLEDTRKLIEDVEALGVNVPEDLFTIERRSLEVVEQLNSVVDRLTEGYSTMF